MLVRMADKWDTDAIIDMLEQYKQESPLEFHKHTTDAHAKMILAQIFAGRGVAFVAEDSSNICGMLLALKNPNLWDPSVLTLNELAYWVNPENRGSSAGYKLIIAYKNYCEQLKAQGDIGYYTISKMVNSPDLDYGRFGFKKLEEMWEQ